MITFCWVKQRVWQFQTIKFAATGFHMYEFWVMYDSSLGVTVKKTWKSPPQQNVPSATKILILGDGWKRKHLKINLVQPRMRLGNKSRLALPDTVWHCQLLTMFAERPYLRCLRGFLIHLWINTCVFFITVLLTHIMSLFSVSTPWEHHRARCGCLFSGGIGGGSDIKWVKTSWK